MFRKVGESVTPVEIVHLPPEEPDAEEIDPQDADTVIVCDGDEDEDP